MRLHHQKQDCVYYLYFNGDDDGNDNDCYDNDDDDDDDYIDNDHDDAIYVIMFTWLRNDNCGRWLYLFKFWSAFVILLLQFGMTRSLTKVCDFVSKLLLMFYQDTGFLVPR